MSETQPSLLGRLVRFFLTHPKTRLSFKEISAHLHLCDKEIDTLAELLKELLVAEFLRKDRDGRYTTPSRARFVIGPLSLHRDGFGFVEDAATGRDIFIPARNARGLIPGDTLLVAVSRQRRGPKPEGEVLAVLARGFSLLIGTVEDQAGQTYLIATAPRIRTPIPLIGEGTDAAIGQLVQARLVSGAGPVGRLQAEIVRVFGDKEDLDAEILSIICKLGLPDTFSGEVEAACAQLRNFEIPSSQDGREDLRGLPFVTIDGETARDFDDAVAVETLGDGRMRLWVSIADVAWFVREGGTLDKAALERGTSVYFPGFCIPMLPEILSNGLCSLRPDEDRLTLTAEMIFDASGQRIESRIYPSKIRSRARLTYNQVQSFLDGAHQGAVEPVSIGPMLRQMAGLAQRLLSIRQERGSLDFDLPEAQIVLDLQGKPDEIIRSERKFSHRLIEEFMLSANEAVADFLVSKGIDFLFRIHEPPDADKIADLQQFVAHFNLGFEWDERRPVPMMLKRFLEELSGLPEEQMINQVLLRSMKQACYSPLNKGHFGLASKNYCHFTSPIRRYPDLQVHRTLHRFWAGEHQVKQKALIGLGETCSLLERRAMNAEREVVDLYKCHFMSSKTGESFEGTVSNVVAFGFFVQLDDYFIEGLVHIRSLDDDYYHFDEERYRLVGERKRRIFQIGDRLRVTLDKVDMASREIDFSLRGAPHGESIKPSPRLLRQKPSGKKPSRRNAKSGRIKR